MLQGIDVSEYQGQIDFDTVKKNKDFIIIRSSFGTSRTDNQFQRNRSEARRVGIPYGLYHYAYPQYNDPISEAEFFFKTLGSIQENEILFLDFEESYTGDHIAWCKGFLDHVSSLTNNYKPLIYLNLSEMASQDYSVIAKENYGLWYAHYDEVAGDNLPASAWATHAFKQFSDNGIVPGIIGKVDQDSFFGDITSLTAYGYHIPVTPDPLPQPNPCQGITDQYAALLKEYNIYKTTHPVSFTQTVVPQVSVVDSEEKKSVDVQSLPPAKSAFEQIIDNFVASWQNRGK